MELEFINAKRARARGSAGATRGAMPKEVASRVETVLEHSPTPDVMLAVATARTASSQVTRSNATWTDRRRVAASPTTLSDSFAVRDIEALDAPVRGGVEGAKIGSLSKIWFDGVKQFGLGKEGYWMLDHFTH